MQDVFQDRKCNEFETQTVLQSNWCHRGDGDQRAAVLIEKSHSLSFFFSFFVCYRVNGHKATVKSSEWWCSAEASSATAQQTLDVFPLILAHTQAQHLLSPTEALQIRWMKRKPMWVVCSPRSFPFITSVVGDVQLWPSNRAFFCTCMCFPHIEFSWAGCPGTLETHFNTSF